MPLSLVQIDAAVRAHDPASPDSVLGDVAPVSTSAVLALLYDDGGPHVVLTRRAAHMRSHANEVAFPGGRRDRDDESLWHTALREAAEEIALRPELVRRVGALDPFVSVGSRSLVQPFVGVVDRPPRLEASPDEVEAILRVPLHELLRDEVWREEIWYFDGASRVISFFELEGDTVWGATGSMLRQLLVLATGVDDSAPGPLG